LNPRPLGYEPYDVCLFRLASSLVAALTSADERRAFIPGPLRLPRLSPSRRVSCTNPCTNQVPEPRVPAGQHGRGDAGTNCRTSLFRPDISPVGANRARVMRCRQSLMTAVGCCCCCHRCCQRVGPVPHFHGLPADDSVTPWSSSPSPGLFPATRPRPVLSLAPPPNPIAAEPYGRRVLSRGGAADHE
jgi:hypothetical protein